MWMYFVKVRNVFGSFKWPGIHAHKQISISAAEHALHIHDEISIMGYIHSHGISYDPCEPWA